SLQYPPLEAVGDVVADAVRITAIQGMDKRDLPVCGDIDGERARCKGYQIGEQRYFEIAIHLELIGDEARLEVHPWRKNGYGDLHGRIDQFPDEQRCKQDNAHCPREVILRI